ncbi:MAG: hypothetical protein H8E44_32450 [Planctomycetes bacterium]|nr:hypothetical protein [Planctomycetota bacterium]MBL7037350.1 hypothetical protein [Pirellulaceae bacterium]
MPTLSVEDLSAQLYETLVRRASEARRSVSEEAKQILADSLGIPAKAAEDYRLPELIYSEEVSPPCDLPLSGPSLRVTSRHADPPLPDPLVIDEQAR